MIYGALLYLFASRLGIRLFLLGNLPRVLNQRVRCHGLKVQSPMRPLWPVEISTPSTSVLSLKTTRKRPAHILEDTDEYVASVKSSPRERLMDAIEQDCSYEHINHLVKTFNMDVVPFRDLLVSKAIESASYGALLWLQENASVNLIRVRDSNGNGLLHQIAKSPHAERFIVAATAYIASNQKSIKLSSYRAWKGRKRTYDQTTKQPRAPLAS